MNDIVDIVTVKVVIPSIWKVDLPPIICAKLRAPVETIERFTQRYIRRTQIASIGFCNSLQRFLS